MTDATHFIEQFNVLPEYRKHVDRRERFSALLPIECLDEKDLATVIMSTHATVEWEKNLAGVKAVLGYYAAKK